MATRVYFYAESLTRATTTTTDYSVAAATLTFQPNASKTYAIFWNVIIDGSATSEYVKVRLRNVTDSVIYSEFDMGRASTTTATDTTSCGSVALYASGAGPAQHTFKIEVASTNVSLTTGYAEACILALELGANDVSTSSTGNSVSTGSTYASKITLSWTPGSAGDYLFIGSMDYQNTIAGADPKVRLLTTGSVVNNEMLSAFYPTTGHWWPYTPMARFSNVSGAQTAELQYADRYDNSTSITVRNAYGVALRLDGFTNKYWAEDRTVHTSTSSSYTDSASTGAFTPIALPHVVIAAGMGAVGTTNTHAAGFKITGNSADLGTIFTHMRLQTGYYETWFVLRKVTPAASSQAWATRYARTAGATTAITSDEHVIALLQLEDVTTITLTPSGAASSGAYGGLPVAIPAGY